MSAERVVRCSGPTCGNGIGGTQLYFRDVIQVTRSQGLANVRCRPPETAENPRCPWKTPWREALPRPTTPPGQRPAKGTRRRTPTPNRTDRSPEGPAPKSPEAGRALAARACGAGFRDRRTVQGVAASSGFATAAESRAPAHGQPASLSPLVRLAARHASKGLTPRAPLTAPR